jgi:hypothetical protein
VPPIVAPPSGTRPLVPRLLACIPCIRVLAGRRRARQTHSAAFLSRGAGYTRRLVTRVHRAELASFISSFHLRSSRSRPTSLVDLPSTLSSSQSRLRPTSLVDLGLRGILCSDLLHLCHTPSPVARLNIRPSPSPAPSPNACELPPFPAVIVATAPRYEAPQAPPWLRQGPSPSSSMALGRTGRTQSGLNGSFSPTSPPRCTWSARAEGGPRGGRGGPGIQRRGSCHGRTLEHDGPVPLVRGG